MADDMEQIVDNLRQPSSWVRVLFMLGFAILLYLIIAPVIFVLMLVQAVFVLITGEHNANLQFLGASLGQYVLQILLFISYNSDTKPFPFTDFPGVGGDEDESDSGVGNFEDTAPASATKKTGGTKAGTASRPAKRKTVAKKKAATKKRADAHEADNKPSDETDS